MGVFISYSTKDTAALTNLLSALRRAHEQFWIDENLRGGELWWGEILEEIRACDVFVFAMSDNSLNSKPCLAELNYAIAVNRPVLPVIVGPIASMRANPLADMQAVDYQNPDHHSGVALIGAFYEARSRRAPLPAVLPEDPPVPFGYLMRVQRGLAQPRLSTEAQSELITELRTGFDEDGHDAGARRDIARLLVKLRDRQDVSPLIVDEVDKLMKQVDPTYEIPKTTTQEALTLSSGGAARTGGPRSTKSSRRTRIALGAVVVLAVVVLAGGVFVLRTSGTDSSSQTSEPTRRSDGTGFVALAEIEPSGRATQQSSVAPADPAGDGGATCAPL